MKLKKLSQYPVKDIVAAMMTLITGNLSLLILKMLTV